MNSTYLILCVSLALSASSIVALLFYMAHQDRALKAVNRRIAQLEKADSLRRPVWRFTLKS